MNRRHFLALGAGVLAHPKGLLPAPVEWMALYYRDGRTLLIGVDKLTFNNWWTSDRAETVLRETMLEFPNASLVQVQHGLDNRVVFWNWRVK